MADFRSAAGQRPTTRVAALTMEPCTDRAELMARLAELRRGESVEIIVTDLGTGLLDFVAAAFPKLDSRSISAQTFSREPSGRGPHFDVYGSLLDKEFRWVAVFNFMRDSGRDLGPMFGVTE